MPATLLGYYRHTDIFFEWHQVIENPAEKSALKAFLAPDSLTSPDNPLRDQAKEGIELFIGTSILHNDAPRKQLFPGALPSGENRLLFSSAQVEYTRYWLHAVGLTEALLPLPNSSYLLQQSALQSVSPVIYKTASELKSAQKV